MHIPLINYGDEVVFGLNGNLSSEFDNVNIINNINQYSDLSPMQTSSGNYFYLLSLDPNTTQIDDLELRLSMLDENNNDWEALMSQPSLFQPHIHQLILKRMKENSNSDFKERLGEIQQK